MAWLAVDKNGREYIYEAKPFRGDECFFPSDDGNCVELPKGTIKKLINKTLTWRNNPVEIKEQYYTNMC